MLRQPPYKIAWFGSSVVSSYWNGAATYYRGIIRQLAVQGHDVHFYEPDAYDRQKYRDMADDPSWVTVHVYEATQEGVDGALCDAAGADIVIKASGIGVFDSFLEQRVLEFRTSGKLVIFWDVDAPATLGAVLEDADNPFLDCIGQYDVILTYGGGDPVVHAYEALGARQCIPVYNAFDPETHYPVDAEPRFRGLLGFMGNRLPDREKRVEAFFITAAERLPEERFILGGNGWGDKPLPSNIDYLGHVFTGDHNAFNCSPLAVLNITRQSMSEYGFSPPTRVFEAAGVGACLITDAWEGIEQFLEPDCEVLVAENGEAVAAHLASLTPERAREIGAAARARVLRDHTYVRRAVELQSILYHQLQEGLP